MDRLILKNQDFCLGDRGRNPPRNLPDNLEDSEEREGEGSRKSRWGQEPEKEEKSVEKTEDVKELKQKRKRKSRWGKETVHR